MGLIWAYDGFHSPDGRNMGPEWAEVYTIAHIAPKWVEHGLE